MKRSFEYKTDRITIIRTALLCVVSVVIAVALFFLYRGGYLSAWFSSVIIAIVALMTLSIPRRIVVLDHTIEIQCISDITEINLREIASVRRADRRRMRWIVPLFGGIGFFGYYGKYFDLKEFDLRVVPRSRRPYRRNSPSQGRGREADRLFGSGRSMTPHSRSARRMKCRNRLPVPPPLYRRRHRA